MKRIWRRILCLLLALAPCVSLAEKTVLLTFTGDCTLGSTESTRGREDSFDTLISLNGYDYPFRYYQEMFAGDDCTVINLENVLADNAAQENTAKVYRFRGPTDFADMLPLNSIEAVCLANNHTSDYGAAGLRKTVEALEARNIGWCRIRDPYTFEKDGIRIAVFAVDAHNIYNNIEWMRKEIRRLKSEGQANAIVVIEHMGTEYDAKRHESQERTSASFIKNGADLVIMHHPHVVQGIDVVENRTVCYSLGNFVFGGNTQIRTEPYRTREATSLYTLVVQAELHFSDDGVYQGQQVYLYPGFISGSAPVNDYQPRPVFGEEAALVLEAVQYDTNFELPALSENGNYPRVVMPYLPADSEETMP